MEFPHGYFSVYEDLVSIRTDPVNVRGKMFLPPHGKEFFHATVSSFLHLAVSDVHPYRVTLSCD